VALFGAIAVAWVLFERPARDVVLVYDVGPDATALEVTLRRGGEVIRRADLRPRGGTARHEVRLRDGEYRLDWRLATPAGPRAGERALEVHESGTIVLPLGR
jgi:hypothetical protein